MGKLGAVVVAAGKGTRMGSPVSKQFLPLHGKPLLVHALEIFQGLKEIDAIVLVTGASDVQQCQAYVDRYRLTKVQSVVAGGSERQYSVLQGLRAFQDDVEWVFVHDGARPFVSANKAVELWKKVREVGAAVLAVPVKDTIKVVDQMGEIRQTPDRRSLWAMQTPQAFRLSVLLQAHEDAMRAGIVGTDDAMLVERIGHAVYVVEGEDSNRKITTPEDLEWAEFKLRRRSGKEGSST